MAELELTEFRVRKGMDVPLKGAPKPTIGAVSPVSTVAVLGVDYPGLRPKKLLSEGEQVTQGQPLFIDRRSERIRITSPVNGHISSVIKGVKRRFEAVVIEKSEASPVGQPPTLSSDISLGAPPTREDVVEKLTESGLWTALRQRPFGIVPDPETSPAALFITAIDTQPLASPPEVVIAAHPAAFSAGLKALVQLSEGPTFLCTANNASLPAKIPDGISVARFGGPHPAGLPGTHIHFLSPVGPNRAVWHIGYQDVIAVGFLLATGQPWMDRIIALTGPGIKAPRLVPVPLGSSVSELLTNELNEGEWSLISGSPLSGRQAEGTRGFLGRYHTQITALEATPVAGAGRPGVMAPLQALDAVMPLDILPGPLMRALLTGNTSTAARLGCLELIEEDMALLSLQCPSGNDYGSHLRSCLDQLMREIGT